MRSKQIPHTCSRKGIVRLAADMKKQSKNPASISKVKVWIKSRTRKDGKPVNTKVAETIARLENIERESPSSSTSNVKDDAISQVFGQEAKGRIQGMGKGMTVTKLAFIQARDKHLLQMQEDHIAMKDKLSNLESLLEAILKNQAQPSCEHDNISSPKSVNTISTNKWTLLDWSGSSEKVAEGQCSSSDPTELVNNIPLGPNAKKVWVNRVVKPKVHFWRPTMEMTFIVDAVKSTIAWPADIVWMETSEEAPNDCSQSNVSMRSIITCKLVDWYRAPKIVAEGCWSSNDLTVLINDVPLEPNIVSVKVDLVKELKTFLWRPKYDMVYIEDDIGSTIAWPVDKVIKDKKHQIENHDNISTSRLTKSFIHSKRQRIQEFEKIPTSAEKLSQKKPKCSQEQDNLSPPMSIGSALKTKSKCKLLDCEGSFEIVAEGHWFSSDPKQLIHHILLDPNAMSVWVDIVKKPDASLWKPSSAMDCMEEAIGSLVAWPADKIIMLKWALRSCNHGFWIMEMEEH